MHCAQSWGGRKGKTHGLRGACVGRRRCEPEIEEFAKVKRAIMKMRLTSVLASLTSWRWAVMCFAAPGNGVLLNMASFVGKVPDNVAHQCVDERHYGVGVFLGQQRIQ